MNEIKFANKIRQALNEGARLQGDRGARIAERLRAARERAVERRRIAHEPVFAPAAADGVAHGTESSGGFSLRLLLAVALLLAGQFAIYSGQQVQRAAEVEELDTLLLSDDLPIDAYLDPGFEAWLKKVSTN